MKTPMNPTPSDRAETIFAAGLDLSGTEREAHIA